MYSREKSTAKSVAKQPSWKEEAREVSIDRPSSQRKDDSDGFVRPLAISIVMTVIDAAAAAAVAVGAKVSQEKAKKW